MFSRYKSGREHFWWTHHGADKNRPRSDHHHPSGRLGGPEAPWPRRRHDHMLASAAMESYTAAAPFEETLSRVRRALSRRGFEILRECDLGSRIRARRHADGGNCRILYVAEPELLATAIATHASAALWLPIPVVLSEREQRVSILSPVEAIVRDRAALLGLWALVERSYEALAEALESVGTSDRAKELR